MDVDIRKELNIISAKMQRIFSKRFLKISRQLSVYLSYETNPNFSVYSQYVIYKFVESELSDLDNEIKLSITEQIEYAYLLGTAMSVIAGLEKAGKSYTLNTILNEAKADANFSDLFSLKNTTTKDLLQVTKNTEYSIKKHIQEVLTKHLNIQNLQNMGREDLVAVLKKELKAETVKAGIQDSMIGLVDKKGRRWKVDTYIDMVVQTKAHQIYVQGLQDYTRRNDGKGDLARIPRNPLTVDECKKYEGIIISLTGMTTGYVTYEELKATGQIFHPRCRHTPIPIN